MCPPLDVAQDAPLVVGQVRLGELYMDLKDTCGHYGDNM